MVFVARLPRPAVKLSLALWSGQKRTQARREAGNDISFRSKVHMRKKMVRLYG